MGRGPPRARMQEKEVHVALAMGAAEVLVLAHIITRDEYRMR